MKDHPVANLTFEELKGRDLSSIAVLDGYYQLWFDDWSLSVFITSTVGGQGSTATSNDDGFFSILRRSVGHSVSRVAPSAEQLTISFDNGLELRISLREADYIGPEALVFSTGSGRTLVV